MVNTQSKVRDILEHQQSLNRRQHKRLAKKIHDDISQKMTLLALQLSMSATDAAPPDDWAKTCEKWAELVMDLGQAIRDVTGELQPRILDENGLKSALRWLANSVSKHISCLLVEPKGDLAVPTFAGNELFNIAREIICDLLIPAQCPRVQMELEHKDGTVSLHLCAADAPSGQPALTVETLEGIQINERIAFLEGSADFNHVPKAGSVVSLTIPVDPQLD